MVRNSGKRRKKEVDTSWTSRSSDDDSVYSEPIPSEQPPAEHSSNFDQLGDPKSTLAVCCTEPNRANLSSSPAPSPPPSVSAITANNMRQTTASNSNAVMRQRKEPVANFEGFLSCEDGELMLEGVPRPDLATYAGQVHQDTNKTSAQTIDLTSSTNTIQNGQDADRPVVLVEPIPDERPTSKFFSNDLALSKALATSPFGKAGIFQIRKNTARNLLVIILKSTVVCVPELLSVNMIGSWNVKCRLPLNQTQSVGVIGPFGEDITDAELTSELSSAGYPKATAERIYKGKEKTKTAMFKVNFATNTLPPYIYLGYQRFKVNAFVSRPWQCFKCQGFCHSATYCKNAARCVGCSGPHNVKECPSAGSLAPKCCNCGGPHTANYGGCPEMKFQTKVEQTRTVQKISYRDAVKVVNRTHPSKSAQSQPELLNHSPYPNKDNAHNKTMQVRGQGTSMQSVATQTLSGNEPPSALCGDISVTKLIELLSKVLCLCGNTANIDIVEAVTRIAKETFSASNLPTPLERVVKNIEPTSEFQTAPSCRAEPADADVEMMDSELEPSPVIGGQYLLRNSKHSNRLQRTTTIGSKVTKQTATQHGIGSGLRYADLTSSLDKSTANVQPSPIIGGHFVHRENALIKSDPLAFRDAKSHVSGGRNQRGIHKGSAAQDDNPKCLSKKQ